MSHNFNQYSGHVLVCAAGMVIRCLAPLLVNKTQDPAVVVVDQQGRFAVSLLSGHLGGANDLARQVAQALEGQAVITTATDNLGLPSLELEAKRLGLAVENLGALAGVSGALVDGRKVPVRDHGGWLGPVIDHTSRPVRIGRRQAGQGPGPGISGLGGLAKNRGSRILAGAQAPLRGPGHGLQQEHRG